MKMYPDDWRERLTTGVAIVACMAAAMMLGHMVGIDIPTLGFWPFVLEIVVAVIVGNLLGHHVGRLMFRQSSGGPPDHPPHA